MGVCFGLPQLTSNHLVSPEIFQSDLTCYSLACPPAAEPLYISPEVNGGRVQISLGNHILNRFLYALWHIPRRLLLVMYTCLRMRVGLDSEPRFWAGGCSKEDLHQQMVNSNDREIDATRPHSTGQSLAFYVLGGRGESNSVETRLSVVAAHYPPDENQLLWN